MIQLLRKRLSRKDEGFTLIELMVVVLIIGILLAIAIPTFLGARGRAQNRSAESNLRNALTAEKTAYTDLQSYVDTTATGTSALKSIEPSLNWVSALATTSKGSNDVQVSTADSGNVVCLFAESASNTYFGIVDVAVPDTAFTASGTYYGSSQSALTCPSAIPATGWGSTTALGGW